ncbi:MAG: oligosaccharide flippase family protein [Chloroflexota bacterium]
MDEQLQRDAGSAMMWKSVQMVGTKLIFFVRLFILARLLSPADFGLMAVAMVAIDVLISVTNFGMVPALVQQKEAQTSHYHAAWSVGLLRAMAISLVVFFGAPVIAVIVGEPEVVDLVRVLAFLPTIDALASIGLVELMRTLAFRQLAIVDLAKTLLSTVIAIALAPSWGVWALVAGSLAGSLTYTIFSYVLAPYRPRLTLNWGKMRPLMHYGRWIFITSLVAVAGSAALRVVVSRQLGAVELGLYFLAARLAFLPTEVASDVMGAVTFPLYARLQNETEQVAQLFRANLLTLSALLVPIFTLIAVLAPAMVTHVLGERWEGTEQIIQLLAIIGILGLVTDIAVPAFKGLGFPSYVTWIEGAQSLSLVLFVFWFTRRFGLLGAPLAWFPAIFGSLVLAVIFLRGLLPRPFAGLAGPLLAIGGVALLGGLVATAVYHFSPTFFGFILAGLSGAALIFGLTWLLDWRFKLGIGQSLATLFPQIALLVQGRGRLKAGTR